MIKSKSLKIGPYCSVTGRSLRYFATFLFASSFLITAETRGHLKLSILSLSWNISIVEKIAVSAKVICK